MPGFHSSDPELEGQPGEAGTDLLILFLMFVPIAHRLTEAASEGCPCGCPHSVPENPGWV